MKKIIFFGCVISSKKALDIISTNENLSIEAIITKKNTNNKISDYSCLESYVKYSSTKLIYINDILEDDMVKIIRDLSPDYIFCIGWPFIISEKILLNLLVFFVEGTADLDIYNNSLFSFITTFGKFGLFGFSFFWISV